MAIVQEIREVGPRILLLILLPVLRGKLPKRYPCSDVSNRPLSADKLIVFCSNYGTIFTARIVTVSVMRAPMGRRRRRMLMMMMRVSHSTRSSSYAITRDVAI